MEHKHCCCWLFFCNSMPCRILFLTFASPKLKCYFAFLWIKNSSWKEPEFLNNFLGPCSVFLMLCSFCVLDTTMHSYILHLICSGTGWSNYMLNKSVDMVFNPRSHRLHSQIFCYLSCWFFFCPYLEYLTGPDRPVPFLPSIFICLFADNVPISADLMSVTMVSSLFHHGLILLYSSLCYGCSLSDPSISQDLITECWAIGRLCPKLLCNAVLLKWA